jgi:hypothetical protein
VQAYSGTSFVVKSAGYEKMALDTQTFFGLFNLPWVFLPHRLAGSIEVIALYRPPSFILKSTLP